MGELSVYPFSPYVKLVTPTHRRFFSLFLLQGVFSPHRTVMWAERKPEPEALIPTIVLERTIYIDSLL